jgi:hypothetical protein
MGKGSHKVNSKPMSDEEVVDYKHEVLKKYPRAWIGVPNPYEIFESRDLGSRRLAVHFQEEQAWREVYERYCKHPTGEGVEGEFTFEEVWKALEELASQHGFTAAEWLERESNDH